MTIDQTVQVKENGPYVVSGSVPLNAKTPIVSEHGEPLAWRTGPVLDEGVAYALCRCGQSSNKPYCDGTHASNSFDGSESAPVDDYADRATSLGGTRIEADIS